MAAQEAPVTFSVGLSLESTKGKHQLYLEKIARIKCKFTNISVNHAYSNSELPCIILVPTWTQNSNCERKIKKVKLAKNDILLFT